MLEDAVIEAYEAALAEAETPIEDPVTDMV
jgi:hypothetical protein